MDIAIAYMIYGQTALAIEEHHAAADEFFGDTDWHEYAMFWVWDGCAQVGETRTLYVMRSIDDGTTMVTWDTPDTYHPAEQVDRITLTVTEKYEADYS